jgi:hypothetical protein
MVLPNDTGAGQLFIVIIDYEIEIKLAKETQLTRFQMLTKVHEPVTVILSH